MAFGGTPDGFVTAAAHDLRAVQAIGDALAGTGKPFVNTSGTAQLALFGGFTRAGTEEDTVKGGPRVDGENTTVALAQRGVRSSCVRLPPTVHSSLDHEGFIPLFIAAARRNGFSAYVGDGANVRPAVHSLDAARLYRLALESEPAGSRLHGVADEGVPFRAIAEAIGRGLGLPTKSVAAEEAPKYLGSIAVFAQVHNPTSSARTRTLLKLGADASQAARGHRIRRAMAASTSRSMSAGSARQSTPPARVGTRCPPSKRSTVSPFGAPPPLESD